MSTPSKDRGGGRGRGGGGGRGRGKATPEKETPPRPQTSQTSRPTWQPRPPTAPVTQSQLVEEFPSLTISEPAEQKTTQPKLAWGAKPSQPVPEPRPAQQQATKPEPVQPVPVKKEELVEEEKKSILITEQEEVLTPPSASLITTQFPSKPQPGTLGRPIKLRTNHYKLALSKPFLVYQYDVELKRKQTEQSKKPSLEVKTKEIMRQMFLAFSNKLPSEYRNKIVYNFSKNLYSLKKLPFEESATYEVEVEKSLFELKLKIINQVLVDSNRYDDPVSIQVLDLIFTHNFNYNCVSINRSFFKPGADFQQIGFGLELWKGAYASVRPSEIGLTWNIDSANAAFMTSKDLLDVASYHYNCDLSQLKNEIERDKEGKSIGASFVRDYSGREIKTKTGGFRKKIKSFGPDSFYKFNWRQPDNTNISISIKDYLKKHYNIDLRYPYLPCIDLGKENYLPLELCSTELKNKKKLNEEETQKMIRVAAVNAPDRMNYINNWIQNSNIQTDPILKEYNISVNLRPIELDGRVLEAPDVEYASKLKKTSREIGDRGSWDHRNAKFNKTVALKRWVIINFAFRVREDAAYNFVNQLIRIGNSHGIPINDPLDMLNDTRKNRSNEEVRRMFENVYNKHKPLDLILVFFGGTTDAYKVMKTCGEITYGIPTQGVEDKNVTRTSDQTISNILLKINTKLGGVNFILSKENKLFSEFVQKLYDGPLMVFGADVTHPAPGEQIESIAAVVGSSDKECCYYGARLFAQKAPKGQAYEMIHDLDQMFISLLQEYFEKNKVYPKKIVFYRDGVSEGQFSLVLRHEMNKIRSACVRINPAYKPGITFIVVQKRHHTRLFAVNQKDQVGKASNIPPGTVVDRHIVTRYLFDFFLCSHYGIQGTSRPCRYFVLHDDNNFSMNQAQILSYYLCHVYSRCPRSVSIPAPAYYAHLAAFRGRDYIRKTLEGSPREIKSAEIILHPNIRNRMFYT